MVAKRRRDLHVQCGPDAVFGGLLANDGSGEITGNDYGRLYGERGLVQLQIQYIELGRRFID